MDLSEISGIGPARAQWLRKAWGVRTVRDLAALSPNDIERELKATSRSKVSRTVIESWVAEARARLSTEGGEPTAPALPTIPGEESADMEGEWRPVASFVVELQLASRSGLGSTQRWRTVVHHVEGDRNKTWPGLEVDALAQWIAEQAKPAGRGSLEQGEPPHGLVEREDVADAVVQVREPARGAPPGNSFFTHIIDGDGVVDSNLVRADRSWTVVFSWSLEDPLSPSEQGEWWLDFLLTPVGRGVPLRIREGPIRLSATRPKVDDGYRYRLEVPAGVVRPAHLETVYKCSASMMFLPRTVDRVVHSGFIDLGIVRFFEPHGSVSGGVLPISLAPTN